MNTKYLLWGMLILLSSCGNTLNNRIVTIDPGKLKESKVILHYAIYFNDNEISQKYISDLAKGNGLEPTSQYSEENNTVYLEIINNVQTTNPIVPRESLSYFSKGIPESEYPAVYETSKALHIVLTYNPSENLDIYSKLMQFISAIVSKYSGYIWDDESRLLYSKKYWQEIVANSFHENYPDIRNHISIHQYQDGELIRSITLGLRKFGLPDLVVQSSPRYLSSQNANLLTTLGQYLIENSEIKIGGRLSFNLKDLKNSHERNIQTSSLLSNGTGNGEVLLEETEPDEGDPQNRLWSIHFISFSKKGMYENQSEFYSKFFGSSDSATNIRHENELIIESNKAKEKFKDFYIIFNNGGMKPGESLLVKAPFKTISGGNEWMWVEITEWTDNKIKGILQNDPQDVLGLKSGAIVHVNQDEILDYIYYKVDGSFEGNETSKIIQDMNK